MTSTAVATHINSLVEGDIVLYHGSISAMNGRVMFVTAVNGGTVDLVTCNSNRFSSDRLTGVRIASVTKK